MALNLGDWCACNYADLPASGFPKTCLPRACTGIRRLPFYRPTSPSAGSARNRRVLPADGERLAAPSQIPRETVSNVPVNLSTGHTGGVESPGLPINRAFNVNRIERIGLLAPLHSWYCLGEPGPEAFPMAPPARPQSPLGVQFESRSTHRTVLAHGVDWDDANTHKNRERHRVFRQEAEDVFFHQPLVVRGHLRHAKREKPYYALGQTGVGRRLFVVFTIRRNLMRVISARDVNRNERCV